MGWTPLSYSQTRLPFSNGTLQGSGQYRDTLRALIVFTQFKNDNYPGDPAVNHRDWPLFPDRSTLPFTARPILSPTPTPPFADSSLTAYFYNQSDGNFILYGETYDSVLVTLHDESRYHRPQGGYGELTKELLDRIDAEGFDFSKYDHNRDGYIDYIFVVLRGDSKRDAKRFAWTGASCLDGRCTGGNLVNSQQKEAPVYDGKILDWNRSGSYIMHRTPGNVSSFHYYIRLMAHEIGHDLWARYFVHIPDNRTNDVPIKHNRGRSRDCIGYALMAGSGGAWDCGGSETISAFERDLLGWIDCIPLRETQQRVILEDLYTSSSCYKIDLGRQHTRLYLSNLQHVGYFDQQRNVGANGQFQIGLRTSGLLVHLATNVRLDVIPADNTLALSPRHEAYETDLFGPGTANQLTPWTRPNINGYTKYPKNVQPSWIAIDNIRASAVDNKTLLFDFYTDFRDQPTIRENSWMGDETAGHLFSSVIRVVEQSTLHLESDITIDKGIEIETGSTVHIAAGATVEVKEGATLTLKHGARLNIDGVLLLNGFMANSPGSLIETGEQGSIRRTQVND